MADIIVLSDDDFSPPKQAVSKQSRRHVSDKRKDATAKQWSDIFSHKSRRDGANHSSKSHHSSRHSFENSSRHSSHRSSDRHSSSRPDKERRDRERSSSGKSIIVLDIDDDDSKSSSRASGKTSSQKLSDRGSKDRHSSHKSSHHHSEKASRQDSDRNSKHHHSKTSSYAVKSTPEKASKSTSEKTVTIKLSYERTSSVKTSRSEKVPEGASADRDKVANGHGRRSGSRRSLAAELGVSKDDCRREDDDDNSRDRYISNGDSRSAKSKRPAEDSGQDIAAPKRARLIRCDEKTPAAKPKSEPKPEPKPEPTPEPDPCQESLEEVCTLLRPLLSGPELKLEDKVRRRHAAVLALAGGRPGGTQHLTGVTQQCAERLRAEPERCFTVLRGFLEQLDQFKLVASSAQSRAGPPGPAAAKPAVTATNGKTGAATTAVKTNGAKPVKASTSGTVKTSPAGVAAAGAAVNGSAGASAASSDNDEKEARRHRRHVAKLEKTLRRLEREIVRQDEQEVDWEDAAGSAYIVGARLKRRYVQVYRYYCRLVGAGEEAQRLDTRRIRFDGTRYPEINRRIEKFVNRTCEFPDFKDVLSLIETANKRDRLRLGPTAVHDQAKEAFEKLGALLQKRRRAALAESMDALTGAEEWRSRDPSAADPALSERLSENAATGQKRLNNVFSEYASKQDAVTVERQLKKAGAEDDEGEEDEEDDDDGEESEVTDEEAEQEPRHPGAGTPDPEDSDRDEPMSDVEMAEPGEETAEPADKKTKEEAKETKAPGEVKEDVTKKEDGCEVGEGTGSGAASAAADSSAAADATADSSKADIASADSAKAKVVVADSSKADIVAAEPSEARSVTADSSEAEIVANGSATKETEKESQEASKAGVGKVGKHADATSAAEPERVVKCVTECTKDKPEVTDNKTDDR